MFYLDARGIYRVTELDALPWLVHGFGTRHSDIPLLFSRLATVKQVHSATCVSAEGRSGVLGQADALLENIPGAVVAVKTADCYPVLLVDERRHAVAAVHSGWRGTAAGIVQTAIEEMGRRFQTEPRDLHAAIGPGIGVCCYEVGPEVAIRFGLHGRCNLDLTGPIRLQLLSGGVTPERIYTSDLCTVCQAKWFHSFRRDKEAAGRLYSFAGIAALQ